VITLLFIAPLVRVTAINGGSNAFDLDDDDGLDLDNTWSPSLDDLFGSDG
jgi:hypothetical protein